MRILLPDAPSGLSSTAMCVITPAILAEYQEVLSRPKLHIRQETAEMVITHFIKYGKTVTPVAYAKPLPDEKDRAFLEAALALPHHTSNGHL